MNFFKILNLLTLIAVSGVNLHASEPHTFEQQNTNTQSIAEFENIEPITGTDNNNSFIDGIEDITDALNTSYNSELDKSFIEINEDITNESIAQTMEQENIHIDLRQGYTYDETNSVVIITVSEISKRLY